MQVIFHSPQLSTPKKPLSILETKKSETLTTSIRTGLYELQQATVGLQSTVTPSTAELHLKFSLSQLKMFYYFKKLKQRD